MRNFIAHALIIGSMALLSACAPNKRPASPSPSKVTVSHPRTEVVTNWDEYPGHIEAVEMVELRPRVSGYLESIHFEDGAEVKAGDLLFVIDPKPYQADLDRASAERQQAETRLELARSDLRRAESLRGTKAISEEEYDSRNKAVRESEAALAASRAAESTAQLNLDYTHITAPVSGKIGRRLVTVGNLVQLQGNSGATVLATIVSMDPIYCYFDVDEGAFLKYRTKMKQATTSDAQGGGAICDLQLADEETFAHRGRLDFFDNQVNPQTGTIRLRAVFPNLDRTLVPGMFATLRVLAGAPEPAMLIPDVAVLSDQGYKYVYIVGNEGTVQARPISTGRNYGPLRAVTKGLAPDDQVVINGLLMLRPGAKVDVEGKGRRPAVRAGASVGSQEGHQPATGEPNRKS